MEVPSKGGSEGWEIVLHHNLSYFSPWETAYLSITQRNINKHQSACSLPFTGLRSQRVFKIRLPESITLYTYKSQAPLRSLSNNRHRIPIPFKSLFVELLAAFSVGRDNGAYRGRFCAVCGIVARFRFSFFFME